MQDLIYLTKLEPNFRFKTVRDELSDMNKFHKTLMSAFPNLNGQGRLKTNLLFRIEPSGPIIVQSTMKPDWCNLGSSYAASEKIIDLEELSFQPGSVLNFRLTANPVWRRPGNKNPIPLREEYTQEYISKYNLDKSPPTVIDWIKRKRSDDLGFEVIACSTSFPTLSNHKVKISYCTFDGQLRITNRQSFVHTLKIGIGKEKAYGCGLLSVAPVR